MKASALCLFTSVLLVSGCVTEPQGGAGVFSVPAYTYQCESGVKVTAEYPSTEAVFVDYKNVRYTMERTVSASGARYVGDGMEWWTKGSGPGSEGMLSRLGENGESSEVIELCAVS